MTIYHIGRDKTYRKCVVVPGGPNGPGCTGCGGVGAGHKDYLSMAQSGGGIVGRSDGNIRVTEIDPETGMFTLSKVREEGGENSDDAKPSRVRYFRALDGASVEWTKRREGIGNEERAAAVPYSVPSDEMLSLYDPKLDDDENAQLLRGWSKAAGVNLTEYNRPLVTKVFAGAKSVADKMQWNKYNKKDPLAMRKRNELFHHSIRLSIVEGNEPDTVIPFVQKSIIEAYRKKAA